MRLRRATAAAAAALLLAACGGDDGDDGDIDPPPEAAPEADEPSADPEDDAADDGQADLPDPAEFITDGRFRGRGVVLPVPEGWVVDEFLFAQGLVAAVAEDDPGQQLVAQALETADLPEEERFDFDELVTAQRGQFAGSEDEPSIDEEVDLEGAERAHHLRFEDVQLGERPDVWVDLVIAEDGDGRVALFNYLAPAEAFDQAIADLLVEESGIDPGIDPDSDPPTAPPTGGDGAPGGDGPQPVEPDEGIGDGAGPPDDPDGEG